MNSLKILKIKRSPHDLVVKLDDLDESCFKFMPRNFVVSHDFLKLHNSTPGRFHQTTNDQDVKYRKPNNVTRSHHHRGHAHDHFSHKNYFVPRGFLHTQETSENEQSYFKYFYFIQVLDLLVRHMPNSHFICKIEINRCD